MKLPQLNRAQTIFLWIIGTLSLLSSLTSAEDYDGHPMILALIGVSAILWALSYRREPPD